MAESDSEQATKLAVPTSPLPFVGIPPCRIADTRGAGFAGAYGPPPLAAGASRNDLLERLAAIPIQTWNYVSQDPSIRHIGPVAQDFFAAFAVGEDERLISTVDADGVALAAIQGLYEVVRQKDARISALEARLAAVEHRLSETP